jgi:HlyD family secretion protein
MTKVVRTSVGESLDVVGTVEPVDDASASFQVAGQVANLNVTVGESVNAGQVLASLDPTALSESVSSAQSTLDSDNAKLTEDEDSQTSSATITSATSVEPDPSTTSAESSSSGTTSTSATVTKDQAALVGDEAKASADQQQEAADLAQAEAVCAGSSSSAPTSTTPTSTTTTTTAPTTTESTCTTALERVSSDQQQVSADQSSVATDETNLAKALSTEEPPSSASTGSSGESSSPTAGASGAAGSASTASDSAEQIASDEASIDSAQADLTEAQQSLDDAQLTSPVSGTVASIGINVGDTVSAGSSTSAITIIGTQSYEVTATLSSTQIASVKDSDSAQVSIDGKSGTMTGTVAQVGPVQSSSSGYTYPAVIALPATVVGLHSGSTANVSIQTGEAKNVVAVPTSAVMTQGTKSYVLVLSSGGTNETDIKVGIVGDIYTQVLSGLQKGNEIVLADYSEAVPSSNTTTVGGLGATGGGFGGGAGFRGGGSSTGIGGG